MKKIDIVIPVYNVLDTLDRTLSSIAEQNHKYIGSVFLIVDGDNHDYSFIINKYSQKLPLDIVYLKKNRGPGYARNVALKKLRADYVYFMDADDEFLDNTTLDKVYKIIAKKNYDVIKGKYYNDKELTGNDVFLQGKFYSRKLIKKYNIKFPNLRIQEPVGFCLACQFLADDIYETEDIYAIYHRDNAYSITRTYKDYIKSLDSLLKAYNYVIKITKRYKKPEQAIRYSSKMMGIIYDLLDIHYGEIKPDELSYITKKTRKFYLKYKTFIERDKYKVFGIYELLKLISRGA